jgi:hypothetical protein
LGFTAGSEHHCRPTRRFVDLRNAGSVEHHPKAPDKSQSETIMRSSDVLLVFDFMEPARLQVPAKVFFYVRTGRPVIACTLTDSTAERILGKSGAPSVCLHPDGLVFRPFRRVPAGATLADWMDELSAK